MSIESENIELNQILKDLKAVPTTVKRARRGGPEVWEEEEELKGDVFCQWTSTDNIKFFPAGKTFDKLGSGLWEPKYCSNRGYFCEKIGCSAEGLLEFPETNSERVVKEIQKFWEYESLFRSNGLAYKRGIILWGPPGSGKSSTIKLILKDVFNRGGVAFKFDNPHIFIEVVRIFRNIEPDTPFVVLMEDIDSIIEEWTETEVLNILDGVEVIDKVVYLATTNYPERLGKRILNRPSRFDRRFKMPHPGEKSRRLYFEHLLKVSDNDHRIDIDKWVKDTEDMSIAHLKELFIAVCILGDKYKTVIETLKSMMEDRLTSEDDEAGLGFAPFNNKEED